MKTYIRALAVVGALVLPGIAAAGDTEPVKAFVPFAFTVGDTTLPAGTYSVSRHFGALDLLDVSGPSGRVFSFVGRVEAAGRTDMRLTFTREANGYTLSEAWLSGRTGYVLPEARKAREIGSRDTAATVTIALNGR